MDGTLVAIGTGEEALGIPRDKEACQECRNVLEKHVALNP